MTREEKESGEQLLFNPLKRKDIRRRLPLGRRTLDKVVTYPDSIRSSAFQLKQERTQQPHPYGRPEEGVTPKSPQDLLD